MRGHYAPAGALPNVTLSVGGYLTEDFRAGENASGMERQCDRINRQRDIRACRNHRGIIRIYHDHTVKIWERIVVDRRPRLETNIGSCSICFSVQTNKFQNLSFLLQIVFQLKLFS